MSAIRFHFDFVSPYAYLAWTQIHAIAERHGREVEPVPTLFAALLGANETKGPAEIPSKRRYVFKETLRHAFAMRVPFKPPPSHPFNPLLGLRAASLHMPAADRKRLIDALFLATWGGGPGITDPEVVIATLDAAGLSGRAIVESAGSPEVKARLKAQTDQALELGIFGVPTMIVEGELFWGVDSLGFVEQRLRGEDPITPELLASFLDVPASAVRRS